MVGSVGKRSDLGLGGEAGWEWDEAVLLRQRVTGQGSAPGFLLSLSVGWDLGTRIRGLLITLLPASFSLPNLTLWLPWRPPSPASLSRCLFSN